MVRRLRGLLVGCLLLAVILPVCASRGHAQTILIVASDSLTYTKRTVSGARRMIKKEHQEAVFHQVLLTAQGSIDSATLDSIKAAEPTIVLTVGTTATKFAKDHFSSLPIVFSAVMYPTISGFVESSARPGHNITGASLDIPTDKQFYYFKQIVPDLKSIGVLYTSNTASLIPPSRIVASRMGLELVPIKVEDIKEIPGALDSLAKTVDGIWSVADPNLFSPQSTKYILLNSLRKGMPFMGFSRHVVESGALFALDFDYKAIGRQAGHLVNRVIGGANPAELSVTAPDALWFHYNENTAGRLNCAIPPELVAIAKEVYR